MPARYAYPLAALSGALLSLPFTDVSSVPAWFALAPVLYLVAAVQTKRRAAGLATVFALTWTLHSFRFLIPQSPVGFLALSAYTSLLYVAGLLVVRALARHGTCSAVFGSAAVWALVEILRSRVPVLGFPWLLLGHALAENAPLRQGAELLGVYGLSLLVAAVNAALAFILPPALSTAPRKFGTTPPTPPFQGGENQSASFVLPPLKRGGRGGQRVSPFCGAILSKQLAAPPGSPARRRFCALAVAVLVLAGLVFGRWRMVQLQARLAEGPTWALVQGCAYHKIERTEEELRAQLDGHLALHERAAKSQPAGRAPELVCWAETMVPGVYNLDPYGAAFRERVKALGVPAVFGADWVFEEDREIEDRVEQRWHNCAFAMDGAGNILTRYAKRRLVPFGEYIPWQGAFPFLKKLRSVTRDTYLPGEKPSEVVRLGGAAFALNICVEDVHPDLAREAAWAGAEMLLNVTNDAWFVGTFGPAAHMQAARLRAVEVRRPLVRVTNSGLTVQIDPLGQVHKPLLDSGQTLEPDTVGAGFLRILKLDEEAPRTLTMYLGEAGAAVSLALLLAAAWICDLRRES